MTRRRRAWGFTLVEMVLTIVILGIIAGVLAPVIANAFRGYSDTKARADLLARGRASLERLGRDLRNAVPNSVNVTNGGQAVEFVLSVAGGRYVDQFDGFGAAFSQTARRFAPGVANAALYVVGPGLGYAAGDVLIIGNTSPNELSACTGGCANGAAVPLNAASVTTTIAADGTDAGSVLSFNDHTFPNSSPGRHYTIGTQTIEVGRIGTALHWRTGAGLNGYDNAWSGNAGNPMLVHGVSAVNFSYQAGAPEGSGTLQVTLSLAQGGETIDLYQEYHVRNTP